MKLSERRARRRRAREMRRRLEELDRLDRRHGLGAHPRLPSDSPARRRARSHRQTGPAAPGLVIAALVVVGVILVHPSSSGQRLRELVGLDERLDEAVEPAMQGAHAFMEIQPGGDEPVSWNPCRPIRYAVNPDGAPPRWESLVQEAVARIETATGFDLRAAGTTDDRRFSERYQGFGRPAPVLIGWADSAEVEGLAGDVAGVGGSVSIDAGGRRRFVTGSIALDTATFDDLADAPDGHGQMRAILVHELAHVIGLDHVEDPGELMAAQNTGRTELGPGDREGLARLGAVSCA